MNIFEMYYENNKSANFWVVRNSWSKTIARVVAIDQFSSGSLKGLGRYPYFNDAKERVFAEVFNLVEVDGMTVLEQVEPKFGACPQNHKLAILSCPGTYAYTRVFPKSTCFNVKWLGSEQVTEIEVKKPSKPTPKRSKPSISIEAINEILALPGKYGVIDVDIDEEQFWIQVSFPYDGELVNGIKEIAPKYRKYSSDTKSWLIDYRGASELKLFLNRYGS